MGAKYLKSLYLYEAVAGKDVVYSIYHSNLNATTRTFTEDSTYTASSVIYKASVPDPHSAGLRVGYAPTDSVFLHTMR